MMKTKIPKIMVLFFVIVAVGFSLKKDREYPIQDISANGERLASNLGIIEDKLSKKVENFAGNSVEIVSEEKTDTIAQSYEDSAKIIVEDCEMNAEVLIFRHSDKVEVVPYEKSVGKVLVYEELYYLK